jgi:hypothetical protein
MLYKRNLPKPCGKTTKVLTILSSIGGETEINKAFLGYGWRLLGCDLARFGGRTRVAYLVGRVRNAPGWRVEAVRSFLVEVRDESGRLAVNKALERGCVLLAVEYIEDLGVVYIVGRLKWRFR